MFEFLKTYSDTTAIIYVSKGGIEKIYSYRDLDIASSKVANLLIKKGIHKGDRVFVYIDRSPETYFFALGILKIGAVFCPIFSSFGPDAVKERFIDCSGSLIITEDKLKENVKSFPHLIIDNDDFIKSFSSMDSDYISSNLNNDDIAIIHYTSGTTGKPKGAVHKLGALKSHMKTSKDVLHLVKGTNYWCTADPAWITGTSYGIFGPLSVGAMILVSDPGYRVHQILQTLEKYKISIWYTAPTLLRMLMRQDKSVFKDYDLSSLKKIFSVGEILSGEVFRWGVENFRLPIFDTWFQTETGSIMIANTGHFPVKSGSMGKPVEDINAAILDDSYNILDKGDIGHLAIKTPWASMFCDYWGNNEKYKSRFHDDWYITGDLAYRDDEGYFYFVSREDDIINTAGHLLSPYEVETILNSHPFVLESAVVGVKDKMLGETVKAYIILKEEIKPSTKLQLDLRMLVRNRLSPFASPQSIEFVDSIPKTESGKIIRG